jgi:hypothetical protein
MHLCCKLLCVLLARGSGSSGSGSGVLFVPPTFQTGEGNAGDAHGATAAAAAAAAAAGVTIAATAPVSCPERQMRRAKPMSADSFAGLLRELWGVKHKDTGAAHTGGAGGPEQLTYNTLRFPMLGQPERSYVVQGQRDPDVRHQLLHGVVDFAGKTVLDIGSNAGGMIFAKATIVKQAVGVDFDPAMVGIANRIARRLGWPSEEIGFHHHDIDMLAAGQHHGGGSGEPQGRGLGAAKPEAAEMTGEADRTRFHRVDQSHGLDLLLDYAADGRRSFDIISMFSLNMWLRRPLQVIAWALRHARVFIIETNGNQAVQEQSIALLRERCPRLSEQTDSLRCLDCTNRRLWVCDGLQYH